SFKRSYALILALKRHLTLTKFKEQQCIQNLKIVNFSKSIRRFFRIFILQTLKPLDMSAVPTYFFFRTEFNLMYTFLYTKKDCSWYNNTHVHVFVHLNLKRSGEFWRESM